MDAEGENNSDFLDGEVDRAPVIPIATWEKHRREIERIYVRERKSFKHLVSVMKSKGFAPTEQQYRRMLRKWGFQKNNRGGRLPPGHMQPGTQAPVGRQRSTNIGHQYAASQASGIATPARSAMYRNPTPTAPLMASANAMNSGYYASHKNGFPASFTSAQLAPQPTGLTDIGTDPWWDLRYDDPPSLGGGPMDYRHYEDIAAP
ncbi:hypothetical protein ABW19_dt0204115 [Dactylella cylindrospora]|nr:hypothetical protein ABW19_dt0204115 [Dactylella cylindrospora]